MFCKKGSMSKSAISPESLSLQLLMLKDIILCVHTIKCKLGEVQKILILKIAMEGAEMHDDCHS